MIYKKGCSRTTPAVIRDISRTAKYRGEERPREKEEGKEFN